MYFGYLSVILIHSENLVIREVIYHFLKLRNVNFISVC
jgi:hypothetical protein